MPALCQTGSWESPPGAAPCSLTPHGQLVHGQPFPNWDPQTRLSTHFQVHPQLRVACPAGFQRTCSVLPGGPNGSRRRTPAPGRPAPLSGGAGKLAGAAPPAASAALRRGVCRQGQQPAAQAQPQSLHPGRPCHRGPQRSLLWEHLPTARLTTMK